MDIPSNSNTVDLPSFGCTYPISYFDYSAVPAVQAVLDSGSAQKTVTCTNAVNLQNGLNITGSSGQNIGFTLAEYAGGSNTPLPLTISSMYPLGPLQGVLIEANATSLPDGLSDSDLQLFVSCDTSNPTNTQIPMSQSPIYPNIWTAYCDYSTSQQNSAWPVQHTPQAFYRVYLNGQYYPSTSEAGIAGLNQIFEYAQPVASTISATVTQPPTVANENQTDTVTGQFTGLPPGTQQTLSLDCGNGNGPQSQTVQVTSTGTASITQSCQYSQSTNAVTAFSYQQLSSNQLESTQVSGNLGISYSAANPSAACQWTNLPSVMIAGQAGANSFTPSVVITNITSLPTQVQFACGNGQTVTALSASIVQIGANGNSLIVNATATSPCTYDFSSLTQNGQPVQTAQLSVGITVNGNVCANGAQLLTVNSANLGAMTSSMTITPIDAAQLGQQVQVEVDLWNPVANLAELNPTAQVNCYIGATPAGVITPVPLTEVSSTQFSGTTTCNYVPVTVNTTREVMATITSTQGALPAPAPGFFTEYAAPVAANTSTAFQGCNSGILLPLMLSSSVGTSGASTYALQEANYQAQLNTVTTQEISNGQYFVLGPSTGGLVSFIGPTSQSNLAALETQTLTVSPIYPNPSPLPLTIYNDFNTQESVQLSPVSGNTGCFTSPTKLTIGSGGSGRLTISYNGGANQGNACLGTANFNLQIVGQQSIGVPITLNVVYNSGGANSLNPIQYSPNPSNNQISVESSSSGYLTPLEITNNFPTAVSVSGIPPANSVNPNSPLYSSYTLGQQVSFSGLPSGETPQFTLSSSPAQTSLPASLSQLANYQVVGNVISASQVNNNVNACSGEDFCDYSAIQSVEKLAITQLNAEYNTLIGLQPKLPAPTTGGTAQTVCPKPNAGLAVAGVSNPFGQYCQPAGAEFVQYGVQPLAQQTQGLGGNNGFLEMMLLSGLGGSQNSGQQQACTNEMVCMMMMQQMMKGCSSLVGSAATLLPLAICSSQAIESGNGTGDMLGLSLLLSTACQAGNVGVAASSIPKETWPSIAGSVVSPAKPGSGVFLLPIRRLVNNPSAYSSISLIKFQQGSSGGLTPNGVGYSADDKEADVSSIYSSSASTPPTGYPYQACSGGSCSLKFDGGSPVLATINKYGVDIAASDFNVQNYVTPKNPKFEVLDCDYGHDGKGYVAYGGPSGCPADTQVQFSPTCNTPVNDANGNPSYPACVNVYIASPTTMVVSKVQGQDNGLDLPMFNTGAGAPLGLDDLANDLLSLYLLKNPKLSVINTVPNFATSCSAVSGLTSSEVDCQIAALSLPPVTPTVQVSLKQITGGAIEAHVTIQGHQTEYSLTSITVTPSGLTLFDETHATVTPPVTTHNGAYTFTFTPTTTGTCAVAVSAIPVGATGTPTPISGTASISCGPSLSSAPSPTIPSGAQFEDSKHVVIPSGSTLAVIVGKPVVVYAVVNNPSGYTSYSSAVVTVGDSSIQIAPATNSIALGATASTTPSTQQITITASKAGVQTLLMLTANSNSGNNVQYLAHLVLKVRPAAPAKAPTTKTSITSGSQLIYTYLPASTNNNLPSLSIGLTSCNSLAEIGDAASPQVVEELQAPFNGNVNSVWADIGALDSPQGSVSAQLCPVARLGAQTTGSGICIPMTLSSSTPLPTANKLNWVQFTAAPQVSSPIISGQYYAFILTPQPQPPASLDDKNLYYLLTSSQFTNKATSALYGYRNQQLILAHDSNGNDVDGAIEIVYTPFATGSP
jgi:hypothetical protein